MSFTETVDYRPLRKLLIGRAGVAKKLFQRCGEDKYLMKEAISLIKLVGASCPCTKRSSERLRVSKSNLNMVLNRDPKNHLATWYMALVYGLTMTREFRLHIDPKIVSDHASTALQMFNKAINEAPGVYEDSKWLNRMANGLNFRVSVALNRQFPVSDVEREDKERKIAAYLQDCRDAETINDTDPDNVDNLTRWGTALMELFLINHDGELDIEVLHDAMKKLRKALSIDPDDDEAKCQLHQAYDLLTRFWDGDGDQEDDDKFPELHTQAYEG